MSQATAEVANDKPVPSRREGALRHTKGGKKPERQQRQKSLKRHSPKEENNSSPKSADEQQDQREAWLIMAKFNESKKFSHY